MLQFDTSMLNVLKSMNFSPVFSYGIFLGVIQACTDLDPYLDVIPICSLSNCKELNVFKDVLYNYHIYTINSVINIQ